MPARAIIPCLLPRAGESDTEKVNQHQSLSQLRKDRQMPSDTNNAACIELRSATGALLFSLIVYGIDLPRNGQSPRPLPEKTRSKPKGDALPGKQETSPPQGGTDGGEAKPEPRQQPAPASTSQLPAGKASADGMMTDAQKRLLFRLMDDKGLEGEKAHQELKRLFQVNSLKEVTKIEASRGIERLIEETKGGKNDDQPPF